MFPRAVHPGEILKGELGITPTARQIVVPPNRVSRIVAGKRSITGDTALHFGHWFGADPRFWLNLQAQYDLPTQASWATLAVISDSCHCQSSEIQIRQRGQLGIFLLD